MQERYKPPFASTDHREPPEGLVNRVMAAINREKRHHTARVRMLWCGALSLVALIALIPAAQELYAEVVQSGFWQFASLIFSDFGAAVAYWQDFVFSLAESFPVTGVAAVLASLLVLLASVRVFMRDAAVLAKTRIYAHI